MTHAVRFAAVIALFWGLSGCLQFEEATVLMPDGSGKLMLIIGLAKDKATEGMGDLETPDPEDLEKDMEGIVAWAEVKKEEKGDMVWVTLAGYFDDINKVKWWEKKQPGGGEEEGGGGGMEPPMPKAAERKLMLGFEHKKGSTELVVTNGMRDELAKTAKEPEGESDEAKKMAEEMIKKMLEGFKFTLSVTVPGDVKPAKGFETSGRKASLVIDEKLILDAMAGKEEAKKKMEAMPAKATLAWEKTTVSDADVAAFQKELAAVKEKWKTMRGEWKKKAAEKKKEK